ncbi:hypothetical protein PF002_g371 [Phytophthora fragariae]|uniref:Uncharacterized protein n=2 Tax=Phytophthora TaxID=4783 RepID=A0A6A4ALG5_9STRA|nr:hypothetical protein PF009_g949 [Phytophthora fragariae]KAE9038018.1 hypothetical protein PR001_g8144 [Phytophthora rubi]KAE9046283.1 hypothetical protein PR002_g1742 [Phytophthora rubi]KAE9133171.1 hypothetical protein PF007_g3455 [Phytophthora fragariae]KAE9258154.1 hypothetical protein PF002_g371 [Phytophthora fragariae]
MNPLTPRQRHASISQRISGRSNRVGVATSAPPPSLLNADNSSDAASDDEVYFIARWERFGAAAAEIEQDDNEFELKRIWAKRRINSVTLCLIQVKATTTSPGGLRIFSIPERQYRTPFGTT